MGFAGNRWRIGLEERRWEKPVNRDAVLAAAALGVVFVRLASPDLLALRACLDFFEDGWAIDGASEVEGRGSGVHSTARKKTFMANDRETNAQIATKA